MPIAPTERVELAALALTTALGHEDVLGGVAGPGGAVVTTLDGERLEGVTVAAAAGGGYAVTLRLRTRVVPLHRLAAELRERLTTAAERSPRAGRVRSVAIQFADVTETNA